jgi:branched-subunit amino acid transport protein
MPGAVAERFPIGARPRLADLERHDSALKHRRVQQIAAVLPVAMLTALVVTDLFETNGRRGADWPALAGACSTALALRPRQSLAVVFLVAIAVAAAVRAPT